MTFLATDMGIKTLAEGIDSEEQLQFVKDLGYDRGQGLLLGASYPITQIESVVTFPGSDNPKLESILTISTVNRRR
jgi:EAL domain-containing protein (putative c-di-GMP-specific phosphodiesterase class I)